MPKLTNLHVSKLTTRGLYNDGDGLYLQITARGTKSWIYRYRVEGKLRDHGLGSIKTLSLAEARGAARDCRKMRHQGLDPIEEKQRLRIAARLEAAKALTFEMCAKEYIEAHKASWRNEKHKADWNASLKRHVYPVLVDTPVGEIDRTLVLEVLKPIWYDKTETASRVRGRIEKVLDYARVQGYREGENPALWRGNLSHVLPAKRKIMKVEHMRALPHAEVANFWKKLKKYEGAGADALRLVILTAARSGEVRGASAGEFDLDNKVWTIPADRMKAGKEHRIPLTEPAVELVKKLLKQRTGHLLFPGQKKGQPISDATILAVLKRMGYQKKTTVHGFRSAFKDWCAECTDVANEVSEMALAHTIGNQVEAAYRRGDLFEKRKALMEDWIMYCIN